MTYRLHFTCTSCRHPYSMVTRHANDTDVCPRCYAPGEFETWERVRPSLYERYADMVEAKGNELKRLYGEAKP